MQPAGDSISPLIEFPSSMKLCQDDLGGRYAFCGMNLGGNSSPVVYYRDAIINVEGDVDVVAVAGQSFIYGIVDDLENEVMETSLGRISNVHPRSLAHSFETFEDFDLARSVVLVEHVSLKEKFIKSLFLMPVTENDNTIFLPLSKPE